ncbi:MAG TPA: sulfatase [Planctomycetaceae bacterium]|nr:sulfatase [Planctomycetaceae bacterium]
MDPRDQYNQWLTRRQFFCGSGLRLGSLALASMGSSAFLQSSAGAAEAPPAMNPALPGFPHFAPRAKSIIYLHMNGGPSQIDTWDYKPVLDQQFDKDLPDSIRMGQRITTMTSGQKRLPVAPSKFKFAQHGQCGRWVSELLPYTAECVDDIALVRTVHTNAINHDPACTFVMTGSEVPGKASLGSWLAYGLGSVSNDLPAFVVLTPSWSARAPAQALFTRMWSSGFLPTRYNGVALRSAGDPVLYLQNPPGVHREDRRRMLDSLARLNQQRFEQLGDPEIQTRIAQYEMAFRMQASVPELTNFSDESAETLEMYGPEVQQPGTFAASALLARRLVERGVRVVQLLHRGWDQHNDIAGDLPLQCRDVDQPTAALLKDLKQRGLLESTLIVWGGEFGRTVYCQGGLSRENYGRDHHPRCFPIWLAGGGIRGGTAVGQTDDFSYNIAERPVHVNDLNTTILHCLGIDHERFTFAFQGLDQRLTGVEPTAAVQEILS